MLSDEDDGNAYQQGQDGTDPDDLEQVPNSFSSGRKRPGIAFPNSCDQGGSILGEHFHCVSRIPTGTSAMASWGGVQEQAGSDQAVGSDVLL